MTDKTDTDLELTPDEAIEQPDVETEATEQPRPKSAREESMGRIAKARREGLKSDGLNLPDAEDADDPSAEITDETAMDDQPPPRDSVSDDDDTEQPELELDQAETEPVKPTAKAETVARQPEPEPESFDIKAKRRELYDAMMAGEYDTVDRVQADIDEYQFRQFELRQQGRELTRAYNTVAAELETQYPDLAPGGDAERQRDVLALKDAYQSQGLTPAEALQRAVGTLSRTWGGAQADPNAAPKVADQQERLARKQQTVVTLPTATARATPKPAPKPKTQAQAIQEMKRARGQL